MFDTFDLQDKSGSVRKSKKNDVAFEDTALANITQSRRSEGTSKPDELDNERNTDLHRELKAYYQHELERQEQNRFEMALDEDFYDNEQWSEEDKAVLNDRGQKPLVFNVISASVDWVTGSEKRTRTNYKILPRRKEDGKPAERKTQYMKYLSDTNRDEFGFSLAFESAVKVGVGWLEDGYDPESETETLYSRPETWRNILWDSASIEYDISDARYLFRSKWIDLDIALAFFPKRRAIIETSADSALDYALADLMGDDAMDNSEIEAEMLSSRSARANHLSSRSRLRIIEGWIRIPTKVMKMQGGIFHGEIADKYSQAHKDEVQSGRARLVEKQIMRMHVAIFTTGGMLWFSESPYRHNRYPFTPIWGKRKGRNRLPYGMIRGLRDPQEDINKRASKALHILSTNRVIMDEGAVDDINALAEEVSRPDAVIVKKAGKFLELNNDRGLAGDHMNLMDRSIQLIQTSSGVTDELLGRKTNATSGIAIQRRQDQGSMATVIYFDNARQSRQIRGEKILANIEQFVSEEKEFRITDMQGKPDYIKVNDALPDNSITMSKADFVIDESDWNATARQAQVTELIEMLKIMPPELAVKMLDLIIENTDLPNREEIVKRIRDETGMRDPLAEEPSEEELARMAALEEQAQMQQQAAMLEMEGLAAKTRLTNAQAGKLESDAILSRVKTVKDAADAGVVVVSSPAGAKVSDQILEQSGYVTKDEAERLDAEAEAEAQAQQAQAQQPSPEQQPTQEMPDQAPPPMDAQPMPEEPAAQSPEKDTLQ